LESWEGPGEENQIVTHRYARERISRNPAYDKKELKTKKNVDCASKKESVRKEAQFGAQTRGKEWSDTSFSLEER